jgi:flagellar motor switch protein FliN/FliY
MAEAATTDQNAQPQAQAPQAEGQSSESVQVHDVELPEAQDTSAGAGNGQIDLLLDAPMAVTVRLGELEMTVRELVELNQGKVLTLDKRVGEPVDLYLRGMRFATGDLVVVGDRLGVRIREILNTQDHTSNNG